MEINFGPELEEFRQEIRSWIDAHQIDELKGLNETGHYMGRVTCDEKAFSKWEELLIGANLMCPQWPKEVGGRGFSGVQMAIFSQELERVAMPRVTRGAGEALVGPVVIAHGTDEQRNFFLPPIITGEHRYCQGFSEPDAGSDLASLKTRGEVVGDEIVITGQKVWTSAAVLANMIFLLCRTNPDAPKHRGISYVIAPLNDNNIEISPIRQISGNSEFCREFIDGARAPLFNVIGGIDNGWYVAMTTLGNERGHPLSMYHVQYEREFWDLVNIARKLGKDKDPVVRQQLAWIYSHIQLIRFAAMRGLASLAADRSPGPEASINKLFQSEFRKRFGEIAVDIAGPMGLIRPEGDDYPVDEWQGIFLRSRAETIFSGTSEIQRKIISERALAMPKGD